MQGDIVQSDDSVHRRAYLVAHARKKSCFGYVGLLSFV